MSADSEYSTEDSYRQQREKQEREKKKAVAQWRKDPVRGEPIEGTGKHRFDNGDGTPYSSLRLKCGGRLIGGHGKSRNYQASWQIKQDRRKELEREVQLRGAVSDVDDSTFEKWEEEIDRWMAAEDELQKSRENEPVKQFCWIGGWDDEGEEGDEVETEGLEDCGGESDREDGNNNGCSTFETQIQFMLEMGIEVKGGKHCVGRRCSVSKSGWSRLINGKREASCVMKAPEIEDEENRRFEDPFGFAIGERPEWHNPNGFVPVVF